MVDSDFLISTKHCFHEVDFKVQAQIISLLRPLGAPAPATSATAAAAAKKCFENIAERAEITKIRESLPATASTSTFHTSLAELIVKRLLLRIRQYLICKLQSLKLFLCVFCFIDIRVKLSGLLSEGLFDLVCGCRF